VIAPLLLRRLHRSGLIFFLLALVPIVLAACRDTTPRVDDAGRSVEGELEGELEVSSPTFNIIYLIRSAGNTVKVSGRRERDGLGEGIVLAVNETIPLEVYEYGSIEDRVEVEKMISPDGSRVDGENVDWSDPPHFFRTDKTIIVYQGNDAVNVSQLESVFGKEFAGSR